MRCEANEGNQTQKSKYLLSILIVFVINICLGVW